MNLIATGKAVGLLINTFGFTKTGELTVDSLTVKFPNLTPPRSKSVCANQRLSRDCSLATSQHPFSNSNVGSVCAKVSIAHGELGLGTVGPIPLEEVWGVSTGGVSHVWIFVS